MNIGPELNRSRFTCSCCKNYFMWGYITTTPKDGNFKWCPECFEEYSTILEGKNPIEAFELRTF